MLRPDFDPCPLCGGRVDPIETMYDFQGCQLRIECRKCRTEFVLHGWSGLDIEKLWNSRTKEIAILDTSLKEEAERLKAENERLKQELAEARELALF